MNFKRLIILLFVTSLLSSNLLWAGEGQLNNLVETKTQTSLNLECEIDNDILHHIEEIHHTDHDCHMSAHLLGLNSSILIIAAIPAVQFKSDFKIQFTTRLSPPPNKPPRS